MKKYLLFVFVLFFSVQSKAQFAPSYTQSSTAYSWEGGGSNVSTTTADDANFNLTIPFTFNYFCNSYTTVNVNTNGLMMFGATGNDWTNVCIPNTASPNNIIAAYWDDLYFDYGCAPTYFQYQTLGSAPNRRFIVSWVAFRANGGSCGTYVYTQVKLFEGTNIIEIHLQSNGLGTSGTIGIENSAGTVGNQVICNSATTNGVAYKFTPNTPTNPGFGSNSWNVMGYDGNDVNLGSGALYKGYYAEPSLTYTSTSKWGTGGSPSDAPGWTGCPVGVDNHTVVSKRTGVPSNGVYSVSVNYHDDNMQFYTNGTNQFESPYCCVTHTDVFTGYMDNTTTFEMRHGEGGGGSGQGLTFTQQNLSATVSKTDLTQNSSCGVNNGTITFSSPTGAVASPVFRSNFSAATGVTVSGNASVTGGYLQLTPNAGSQSGGAILANSTATNASIFRGEFDFRVWDGSAADGFSFNYADMSGSPANSGENGFGNGLSICFVTYSGAGGPIVKVKYAGVQIGGNYSATLRDGNYRQCVVTVNSANQLNLSIAGSSIISNLALPSAFQTTDKTNWQFSFAGRTGGATDAHRIDNVVINAYDQYEYSINGTTWNNTGVFTGLAPGTYTPRIRNKAFTTYPVSLSNVTIAEPPVASISSTVTNETCPTSNNGAIDVTMTGGLSQVRYIRIKQNKTDAGAYINLSELQAYEIFTGTNVALNKTVIYNSVHSSGSYPGSELVNNIMQTTGDMYHSNGTGTNEWVEVDLGAEFCLDNIRIWNRNDCCWDRSSNFQMILKNAAGTIVYSNAIDVYNAIASSPGASPTFNVVDLAWSPTKTSLDLTGLDAGSYTLNYSDAAGCTASHAKTVGTIKTESVAASSATATQTTICNGGSTTLSVSGGSLGTGASWKWYTASCGGTLVGTGSGATATLSVSPTSTTTYYARAEGDCNTTGCVSLTITVNPISVGGTASNSQTICLGSSPADLTLSGNTGSVVKWQWATDAAFTTPNDIASSASTPLTAAQMGALTATRYYRAVVQSGVCAIANSSVVTITVTPTPTASAGLALSAICQGGTSTTMGGSVGGSATGGTWTGGAGTWTNASDPANATYTAGLSESGSITLTLTTTGMSPCSAVTATKTIMVNQNPIINSGSALSAICQGGTSAAMGGSVGGGATGGTWTGGAGTWTNATDPANATYTAGLSESGSITLTLNTSGGSCGTTTATKTIMVDIKPTAAAAGSDLTACGIATSLKANLASVGTGTWSTVSGSSSSFSSTSANNATVTATTAGSHTYRWTVTNGACSSSDDVTIYFRDAMANVAAPSADARLVESCVDGDWTYYSTDPASGGSYTDLQFAIKKGTATINCTPDVVVNATPDAVTNTTRQLGLFTCGSYWDVHNIISSTVSASNPVDVRFFYTPSHVTAAQTAATTWANAQSPTLVVHSGEWFKTVGTQYDPSNNTCEDVPTSITLSSTLGTLNGANYVDLLGITSFSGGTIGFQVSPDNRALPVTYTSFTAKAIENSYIKLDWSTASEIDNKGFDIERSEDGVNFTRIGWVNGNGNSTTVHYYTLNDNNVVADVVYYYRLRQVDNTGRATYSSIVSARISGEDKFTVSDFIPTKVEGKTHIEIYTTTDRKVSIEIYNTLGQKVEGRDEQLQKGTSNVAFDFSHLASGTYSASIRSNGEFIGRKFLVVR